MCPLPGIGGEALRRVGAGLGFQVKPWGAQRKGPDGVAGGVEPELIGKEVAHRPVEIDGVLGVRAKLPVFAQGFSGQVAVTDLDRAMAETIPSAEMSGLDFENRSAKASAAMWTPEEEVGGRHLINRLGPLRVTEVDGLEPFEGVFQTALIEHTDPHEEFFAGLFSLFGIPDFPKALDAKFPYAGIRMFKQFGEERLRPEAENLVDKAAAVGLGFSIDVEDLFEQSLFRIAGEVLFEMIIIDGKSHFSR